MRQIPPELRTETGEDGRRASGTVSSSSGTRMVHRLALVLALVALPAAAQTAPPDSIDPRRVTAVDLFGLRRVPEAAVRAAVGLRPGGTLPGSGDSIRARLRALPGVADVDLSTVCCVRGGSVVFVGIRETGTPAPRFRPAPTGAARLPADVVAAGEAAMEAWMSAVRRGDAEEDRSRGYSLMRDSAARAAHERFIGIAATRWDTLRAVLRTSADAEHRALAARIVAYGPGRRAVLRELLDAVRDPDDGVRNDAVRALAVMAEWARQNPQAGVRVPYEPFLELIDSPFWTDRNKGTLALAQLTASRDPALLVRLRTRPLAPLVEMARWSSEGHASAAFRLLARIAGIPDDEAMRAWTRGDRERVISRAIARRGSGMP